MEGTQAQRYEAFQCFDGECVPGSKFVCVNCPLYPSSAGDIFLQKTREEMDYPKMKVYFVINGTTPIKAFRRNGLRRFLVSAYSTKYQQAGARSTVSLLEDTEWILDSGMVSAWRDGRKEWVDNQKYIASLAKRMTPTYVSHLDIPVEKSFLRMNRYSRKDAIKKTVSNARDFLDEDVGKSKRIFTLQGWTLEEYIGCLHEFQEAGILEHLTSQGGLLGIGSMCLRKPGQGLYGILGEIRKVVTDIPIHVWGIGQLSYQKNLVRIGIDSTDTGSVLMQWAFSERRLNSQEVVKGQTTLEVT